MPAKKATAKKATAKKATAKPVSRASAPILSARPGDLLVIDSSKVGSLPREGEVLEVIQGDVSPAYRVRWADGHQTLIAPKSGTARIVRKSGRA